MLGQRLGGTVPATVRRHDLITHATCDAVRRPFVPLRIPETVPSVLESVVPTVGAVTVASALIHGVNVPGEHVVFVSTRSDVAG